MPRRAGRYQKESVVLCSLVVFYYTENILIDKDGRLDVESRDSYSKETWGVLSYVYMFVATGWSPNKMGLIWSNYRPIYYMQLWASVPFFRGKHSAASDDIAISINQMESRKIANWRVLDGPEYWIKISLRFYRVTRNYSHGANSYILSSARFYVTIAAVQGSLTHQCCVRNKQDQQNSARKRGAWAIIRLDLAPGST